jgi:hypothetical protein
MEIARMAATSRSVCQAGAMAGGVAGSEGCTFICGAVESFSGVGKEILFDRIAEMGAGGSERARPVASIAKRGVRRRISTFLEGFAPGGCPKVWLLVYDSSTATPFAVFRVFDPLAFSGV